MTNGHSPLRLSVRTESGHVLGSVVDISIDLETQAVLVYHVKPSRLVPDMVISPLLIHRDQVVSITTEGLVVDDSVATKKQPNTVPQPSL